MTITPEQFIYSFLKAASERGMVTLVVASYPEKAGNARGWLVRCYGEQAAVGELQESIRRPTSCTVEAIAHALHALSEARVRDALSSGGQTIPTVRCPACDLSCPWDELALEEQKRHLGIAAMLVAVMHSCTPIFTPPTPKVII
jgi:hypothetical protein